MMYLAPLLLSFLSLAHASPSVTDSSFPADYATSRARFRDECTKALGSCKSYKVDSEVDPDLTIDTAFIGGGGTRLLVLQSGIHGIEANAGAAVQHLMAEKYAATFVKNGVDVLMIHALDPYGYKYGRRTDEFNVNLNRNFPAAPDLYLTKNDMYERVRDTFEPAPSIERYGQNYRFVRFGLVKEFVAAGFDKKPVSEAMNSGQYAHDTGVNFGGRGPTQQVEFLRALLTEHLPKYRKVLFLDLHTGLGEDGTLHVMPGSKSAPGERDTLKDLVGSLGEGLKVTDVNTDQDFFSTKGDVIDFVNGLAPAGTAVVAATAEFGTRGTDFLSQLHSGVVIISENQAHHHGGSPRAVAKVKRDFADLFNPTNAEWRAKVLAHADRLLGALATSF